MELVYFNIEGLAETARLCFQIGGVEFQDSRLENFAQWATIKEGQNFKDKYPGNFCNFNYLEFVKFLLLGAIRSLIIYLGILYFRQLI